MAPTAPGYGDCVVTSKPAPAGLAPITAGTLTMAGPLPFPLAYESSNEQLTGGYLYCIGAEIASRSGLGSLQFRVLPFTSIITGQATGYDLALVDATVTDERRTVVDFAAPYGERTTGVLTRAGSPVTAASMPTQKLGVIEGTLQQSAFAHAFPKATITAFPSPEAAADAVKAGTVGAALLDTVIALTAAHASQGSMDVVAQYHVGGEVAPVLPKGSANLGPVSVILEMMKEDGTLDAIRAKWLAPALGKDPSTLPQWTLPA